MGAQGLSASTGPHPSGQAVPLTAPPQDVQTGVPALAVPEALRPRRGAHRGRGAFPLVLALVDGAAMAAAALAAGAGRPAALGAAALTVAAGAASGGLYRRRRVLSVLDDAGAMLIPALVAGMLVAFAFLDAPWTPLADSFAIGFWVAVLYFVTALIGRSLCYVAVRAWRRRRNAPPSTLVIGGGAFTGHVLDTLRRHAELGLKPVGRIHPSGTVPPREASGPILGGLPELRRVIRTRGVTDVVIVGDEVPRRHVEVVARLCGALGCEVLLVPTAVELLSGAGERAEHLCGIPCVTLAHGPQGRPTWYAKRAFDVVAAALALAVVWPLMAACAIAVRIEGGPGVLFRQRRVGMGGRTFVLLKFRTLKPADEAEADTRWSVDGDERMGPVGCFLRRTSLDELPQLWNVLRGDMSLVGPRPERPYFVERFSNEYSGYAMRHRVPVGITGWSQVHGLRGDTSIALRARFDNHYIDTWSFWGDLKILLLTIQAVFMVKAP